MNAFGVAGAVITMAVIHASASWAMTDDELLERVRETYRNIDTLTASFEQQNDWDLLEESASYRGTLTVSADGRVRIEYVEPSGHLFVADGHWLWTYVPESGQVLKSESGEDRTELSRLFLDFLEGNRVTGITHRDGEVDIALETNDTSSLRELMVSVDPDTGLGTHFTWTDTEGNVARYRFNSTEVNHPLAPDTFVFQPPEGVDVIELGPGR